MSAKISKRSMFFSFFLLWIFISAFYYLGNFLSGNVIGGSANVLHVLIKYLVAFLIGVFFIFSYRQWSLLLLYCYLFFLVIPFLYWFFLGHNVLHAIVLFMILFSFLFFSYFFEKLTEKEVHYVLDAIVYSSLIVSFVSFYEYFFMWPILGDYWNHTGGYRSISTLLNPNNLGIYLGVSIIILILRKRFPPFVRIIFVAIVFTAFVMSGSRTAFVSIIMPLLIGSVFVNLTVIRFKPLVLFFSIGLAFLVMLPYLAYQYEDLFFRFRDFQTASIRIEKYTMYLANFDSSYFLPDFLGSRFVYVSENSYFHLVNSFGLIVTILILLPFFIFRRVIVSFNSCPARKVFVFIVFYYLIAFFFDNMLASFPNNQLFFFALGAIVKSRSLSVNHSFKYHNNFWRSKNA